MKRRLALLTAICMLVFSLQVSAQGFTDMPQEDSQYYDAFVYAINKKLISGDGTNLNPDSYITQAEALTIISRIKPFDCEETDITQFGVSKDKWYYSTVAKAYTLGYVTADTLSPEKSINRISANAIIGRVYGKTPTPWPNNELCTRAEFIREIYLQAPDGKYAVTQTPNEGSTDTPLEGATEAPSEFTDLKAKAAQEAMQLAFGVLPDGTSYVTVSAYKDVSQTGWASGKITDTSSSRPSRPSNPGNGNNKDDDDESDEEPTEAPTQAPTIPGEEEPTEAPTVPDEEPTEPETPEPTYGEYDGPIDNDKDNVIDDPFHDGWTPPGMGGGDDGDDSGSGSGSGSGGWDEEDEDFDINDADDPDYIPDTKPTDAPSEDETDAPSEGETDAPSEGETDAPSDGETDAPSESETDAPSEGETDVPSEGETDAPSEGETDAPSDGETDAPSDGETDAPSESETDAPSEGETDAPSDGETDAPSDGEATLPSEEETDDGASADGENGDDNGEDDTNNESSAPDAALMSKEWWFE